MKEILFMCETNQEKVNRFIEFNRCMIDIAMSENNLAHNSVHAKALLCAIIDSLVSSRFLDANKPGMRGTRFKDTITLYSDWKDCNKVSSLHLFRAIEKFDLCDEEFASLLQKFPKKSQSLIMTRGNLNISDDQDISSLEKYWPLDDNGGYKRLGKNITPSSLQHTNLLWLYRNSLVHEFRIPGLGVEKYEPTKKQPYYEKTILLDGFSFEPPFINSWELIYPTGFFLDLSTRILENVSNYHLKENTSPFTAYSEGNYWLPEFNQL